MVSYRIEFRKSAVREFHKLPPEIQRRMMEALTLLAMNPFSELLHIKKLRGAESLYRIRIGDYRVVYEVTKDPWIVVVVKVGHRKEVYR